MNSPRILVVDDDASVRRVLKLQLEESGYAVLSAGDGKEAAAIVEKERPQLVITDLMMPGSNGLELLQQIKARDLDTTVIMITAFGSVESAVSAMRAGAYDYITKPIDYDALLLAATANWRFQPATRSGVPVKYRKLYEVIVHSR